MPLSFLVTGSRGFIGRHLVTYLKKEGHHVEEWPADIFEQPTGLVHVDAIVHLAGIPRYEQFAEDPKFGFQVNTIGTHVVLDYALRIKSHCIFASTSGAAEAKSPYAMSKWLAEQLCEQFSRRHQLSVTILRIFNPYGAGQHPSFLISEAIESLKEEKILSVRMPHAVRDFIYVEDVAKAFLQAALHPPKESRLLNIGSGVGTKISECLGMVESVFGKELKLEMSEAHPEELSSAIANIEKTKKEIDWSPTFSLHDGIKQTKILLGL